MTRELARVPDITDGTRSYERLTVDDKNQIPWEPQRLLRLHRSHSQLIRMPTALFIVLSLFCLFLVRSLLDLKRITRNVGSVHL